MFKIGSDLGNQDVQCCVLTDLKMAQAVLEGQHFVLTPCKVDLPIVGECRMYIAKLAGTTAARVEVEFSLKHVCSWLWASQDAESRLERFKKHRGSIEHAFRVLFKSDPPELRQTAHDKTKDVTKAMMHEKTLPSKWVFALCYFGMVCPDFSDDMPDRVSTVIHALLESLCQIPGVCDSLSIIQVGTGGTRLPLTSDTVDADSVWPGSVKEMLAHKWQSMAEIG